MKKILLTLTISAFALIAGAQTITWTPNTRLTEKSFTGQVTDTTRVSFSNILMVLDVKPNKRGHLVFKPTAIMEADLSFINPNLKVDGINSLWHERTRFDLTQLYVYKMQADLDAMEETSEDARNERAASIFHIYLDMAAEADQRYDHETYFARSPAAQADWDNFVARELAKFAK